LINEIPIVVKIYAISFIVKLRVLSLRIVKMANSPMAMKKKKKTVLSIDPIKKIIIPISIRLKR